MESDAVCESLCEAVPEADIVDERDSDELIDEDGVGVGDMVADGVPAVSDTDWDWLTESDKVSDKELVAVLERDADRERE